jgi:5-methylcytosine-specific restriction protein A
MEWMQLLVSCTYCGGYHERGYICKAKPSRTKEQTSASKFRSKRVWTEKARAIKKRDKYLCQWCKTQDQVFTFDGLEVHHIVPISMDWNKRLDDYNLVTLCSYHHKQADKQLLDNGVLYDIAYINTNHDMQRDI